MGRGRARGSSSVPAVLLGAIEHQRAFAAPLGGWQRHADDAWARVRGLADPSFDAGLAAGRELEFEDAVAYARGETTS